jgi:hypothetical protein
MASYSRVRACPNLLPTIQLPGRRLLVTASAVSLLAALMLTTSSRLARLEGRNQTKRQEIIGTVMYQGTPLKRGKIVFLCQVVEPEMELIDATADIVDGKFHIPKSEGPMPGWFLVRILLDPNEATTPFLERRIVSYKEGESSVMPMTTETDTLVRLHWRRVNRFDIRLEDEGPVEEQSERELACANKTTGRRASARRPG